MRIAVLLALVLAIPSLAYSAVITVPDDYPTIQSAISASVNGDLILVKPGTYVENIDFLGKAITVKSTDGPESTIINGNMADSVVSFINYEELDSVLDGFLITNGKGRGGGVECTISSPTITNNIIIGNEADLCAGANSGGGIFCLSASPMISNNTITRNNSDRGGGIFLYFYSFPKIINNVIAGNTALESGGGIYGWDFADAVVTNNTIYGNLARNGGGMWCSDSIMTVTNTILWENTASRQGPEIYIQTPWAGFDSILNISRSDVKGGLASAHVEPGAVLNWGAGMIDAAPEFVDPALADLHIMYTSPCRDAGDNAAPDLPAEDFEGDPRAAHGTADIGADEFYTHLYYTGKPAPGAWIYLNIAGLPSSETVLITGQGVLDPPIPTIYGAWHLDFPVKAADKGPVPLTGVISLHCRVPPNYPVPSSIPIQALVSDQLTNLCVMKVK